MTQAQTSGSGSRNGPVVAMEYIHNRKSHLIVAFENAGLKIFDTSTSTVISNLAKMIKFHSRVSQIRCHPTKLLMAVVTEDNTVSLWDLRMMTCLNHLSLHHSETVQDVRFDWEGKALLLLLSRSGLFAYDSSSLHPLLSLHPPPSERRPLFTCHCSLQIIPSPSPSSLSLQVLVGGDNGCLYLWGVYSSLPSPSTPTTQAASSAQSALLAVIELPVKVRRAVDIRLVSYRTELSVEKGTAHRDKDRGKRRSRGRREGRDESEDEEEKFFADQEEKRRIEEAELEEGGLVRGREVVRTPRLLVLSEEGHVLLMEVRGLRAGPVLSLTRGLLKALPGGYSRGGEEEKYGVLFSDVGGEWVVMSDLDASLASPSPTLPITAPIVSLPYSLPHTLSTRPSGSKSRGKSNCRENPSQGLGRANLGLSASHLVLAGRDGAVRLFDLNSIPCLGAGELAGETLTVRPPNPPPPPTNLSASPHSSYNQQTKSGPKKGTKGGKGSEEDYSSSSLLDLAKLSPKDRRVNRRKLSAFLTVNGSFPDKYRPLIYRFLLRLPNNTQAFSELVAKGTDPGAHCLLNSLPIKSPALASRLLALLSALAHWSPLLSQVPFLPTFAFPFMLIFGDDEIACFETILTLFMWWGKGWFVCFPHPPPQLTDSLDRLLQLHDPALHSHLKKAEIAPGLLGWNLISSLFTEVLDRKAWLEVMDWLVLHTPPPSDDSHTFSSSARLYLALLPIALLKTFRSTILSEHNPQTLSLFLTSQMSLSGGGSGDGGGGGPVSRLRKIVEDLVELTPEAYTSAIVSSPSADPNHIGKLDGTIAAGGRDIVSAKHSLALSSGPPIFPLPSGRYPLFDGYPKEMLDLMVKERGRVSAMRKEVESREDVLRDVEGKAAKIQAQHAVWVARQEQLLQARAQAQREMMEREREHLLQMEALESRVSQAKLQALESAERSAREELLLSQKLAEEAERVLDEGTKHLKEKTAMRMRLEEQKVKTDQLDAQTADILVRLHAQREREERLRNLNESLVGREEELETQDMLLAAQWRAEEEDLQRMRRSREERARTYAEIETQERIQDQMSSRLRRVEMERAVRVQQEERLRKERWAAEEAKDALEAAERVRLSLQKQELADSLSLSATLSQEAILQSREELRRGAEAVSMERERLLEAERIQIEKAKEAARRMREAQTREEMNIRQSEQMMEAVGGGERLVQRAQFIKRAAQLAEEEVKGVLGGVGSSVFVPEMGGAKGRFTSSLASSQSSASTLNKALGEMKETGRKAWEEGRDLNKGLSGLPSRRDSASRYADDEPTQTQPSRKETTPSSQSPSHVSHSHQSLPGRSPSPSSTSNSPCPSPSLFSGLGSGDLRDLLHRARERGRAVGEGEGEEEEDVDEDDLREWLKERKSRKEKEKRRERERDRRQGRGLGSFEVSLKEEGSEGREGEGEAHLESLRDLIALQHIRKLETLKREALGESEGESDDFPSRTKSSSPSLSTSLPVPVPIPLPPSSFPPAPTRVFPSSPSPPSSSHSSLSSPSLPKPRSSTAPSPSSLSSLSPSLTSSSPSITPHLPSPSHFLLSSSEEEREGERKISGKGKRIGRGRGSGSLGSTNSDSQQLGSGKGKGRVLSVGGQWSDDSEN